MVRTGFFVRERVGRGVVEVGRYMTCLFPVDVDAA